MKPTFISFVLVLFLFSGNLHRLMAQTPEKQYQKGLVKEEGEGALQEAISLYNQVAKNQNADKTLQAKALLHIGMCYEKLGKQEAVRAYQQLVSNFPEQKNEVNIARERLSKLVSTESSRELAIRLVWTGPGVDQLGSVSADGEHLSFVDWETGNLSVRNLKTGENKPLTTDGTWKDPRQYAIYSLISPDAKQTAYMWSNADGIIELRLIKSGENKPEILFTCSDKEDGIAPCLWFSDGKRIIFHKINRNTKIWQLSLLNLVTKKIQVLAEKPVAPRFFPVMALSPDEKQVAFSYPGTEDQNKKSSFDIYLLSLDNKSEISLIRHPAKDQPIGWLPGSNELLFASDRTGTWDIWRVNTADPKSFESPKPVFNNIGEIRPMGFGQDGTLYYGIQSDKFESFILPVDPQSGKISDSPKTALSGPLFDACWLSDGETVICRKYPLSLYYRFAVYNTRTGDIRTLADNIIARGSQRISPDEKSVLVVGSDSRKAEENDYGGGIYSVDISTGNSTEIMRFIRTDNPHSNNVEWSHDGKSIFFTTNNTIVRRNLETHEEKVIYTDKNLFFNPVLKRSPDGKHLIFDGIFNTGDTTKLKKGETFLLSIPEDGGEINVLCKAIFPGYSLYKRISNSPDGKYIYFTAKTPEIRSVLYRLPAAGGLPEIVWQSKDYFIAGTGIHPDGGKIVLSTSVSQIEIRAMENLCKKVTEVFSKTD